MLDEEEKNAALSDKKKRMWVQKCFRSRNQKDRMEEIAMEGFFAHSKLGNYSETHLGIPEDKQLPEILCLTPHVIMGDEAFPLKTYLMEPYPGSQSKGDNEKSIFNYIPYRSKRVVENAFGILRQKLKIYQWTLQSLPENVDIILRLVFCIVI